MKCWCGKNSNINNNNNNNNNSNNKTNLAHEKAGKDCFDTRDAALGWSALLLIYFIVRYYNLLVLVV